MLQILQFIYSRVEYVYYAKIRYPKIIRDNWDKLISDLSLIEMRYKSILWKDEVMHIANDFVWSGNYKLAHYFMEAFRKQLVSKGYRYFPAKKIWRDCQLKIVSYGAVCHLSMDAVSDASMGLPCHNDNAYDSVGLAVA